MCCRGWQNADAEDFYVPESLLDPYLTEFSPKSIFYHLDDYHHYFELDVPVLAEPKPGRNKPCLCGSGTKYKRCCGAPE